MAPWKLDRVREMSSTEVVLDWISTDNHYARWVGGEETLISLSKEVQARLHERLSLSDRRSKACFKTWP